MLRTIARSILFIDLEGVASIEQYDSMGAEIRDRERWKVLAYCDPCSTV
jgi:hypothetical protein